MASSQLICSNLPSPRLPVRFVGCCRRSGWYCHLRYERPRTQALPHGVSSSDWNGSRVSTFVMVPSLTCALMRHLPPQSNVEHVFTTCVPSSAALAAPSFLACSSLLGAQPPNMSALAPTAPVSAKNDRRDNPVFCIRILPLRSLPRGMRRAASGFPRAARLPRPSVDHTREILRTG